ncbi:MAG: ABC transporter ATP-binding protein [Planctomycetota bacterium]|nr:ABC transporter ATP-binding protein [Planctomycetota bacterium]
MRTAYRRILRYVPRYRLPLLLGALCVIGSRLLMVYAPRLLGEALNALERGGEASVDQAIGLGWVFLGVSLVAGVFTYLMRVFLVGTSRRAARDLQRDLFAHVESLPARFFDRTRTGDLLARMTSDVEAVRFSLGPGLMYVGSTLVLFPLAVISMVDLAPSLTLAALGPLLAIMVVVRLLGPGIMRRTRSVQEAIGDLSARAQESFAGARVVRAYATEPVEESAFGQENEGLVRETLGLANFRALLTGSLYVLGGGANLVVLWYGGNQVISGELGLGYLATFMLYVGMLIWPMISVGWVVSALQRSAAAMERIDEIFDRPAETSVATEPAVVPELTRGAIRVSNLTFQHEASARPALEGVSFEIEAGSTCALVGPVGAGKSTLLSLLTREYEPPSGAIALDDVDITSIPLQRLRSAFAVVPQDAFLFSTTLHANLEYAVDGELTAARAREVLRIAGLDEELTGFPKGLDTVVGERGLQLSGGQKQRTTVARALLREAPVLLLDDCLSAVDTQTEARILDALREAMRRRTAIVVAHRLSTVRDANLIVVLDAGRVVEMGTHADLVKAGGWYAETYAEQRLEAELEGLA